jgi:hypothetical protein
MGLDAWVRCDCINRGAALAHPFPELLRFDETGEPTLDTSIGQPPLEKWLKHDEWLRHACPHGDRLIERRLGNAALIWKVRESLASISEGGFPLIRERVIYSDSHSGDWIPAADSRRLLEEARRLRVDTSDPLIVQFATDLIELAQASIATGNPIVF